MFSSSASQVSSDANFIEDVFQTWLYTGNGSTQTIANGIDLAGKGGLVWTKARPAPIGHGLVDTARGGTKLLQSNTTAAEDTFAGYITSFNANGYTLGASGVLNDVYSMVSWTFREQPKFFDVVTYTGNGTDGRSVAHNLGVAPKFIIIKCTSNAGTDWVCAMTGVGSSAYIQINLNSTGPGADRAYDGSGMLSDAPTSTDFKINQYSFFNGAGRTYVAYLFAHNAGGFGLTGNDNVISCGSFTSDGAGNATVNLGYEPQFLMYKRADSSQAWYILDTMRGWPVGSGDIALYPNTAGAEENNGALSNPTSTGFTYSSTVSATFIYIAIRKNMKS